MKFSTRSAMTIAFLLSIANVGSILVRSANPVTVHAAGGGPSVTIEGPLPLPVTSTAIQPIQVTQFGQSAAPGFNLVLYVVPAGKRLIVEHFSSEASVTSGTVVSRYILGVAADPQDPGASAFSHFISAFAPACDTCATVASQPIRMYVEAGQALVANVAFGGVIGPTASVFVSASGYLVNVS